MAKLILSLDGGGIRGAATAEFLKNLEGMLHGSLHDNFDMFVGTSTGGILATCIGLLKMGGIQITQIYSYENANEIMNKSFWDKRLGLAQGQPKYDGKGKRNVLEKYFRDVYLNDAIKPTLVVTYDVEKRKSAVLKSEGKEKIFAVDAVDATSAAPLYFPTVEINNRWLIDGGVIANNPTICAFAEARNKWPKEKIKILSVGTGIINRKIDGKESQDYGALGWITHDLLGIVMDESVVNHQAKAILGDNYLRVNSKLDYVKDDMDDCSQGNINNLKKLGNEWFYTFGKQAVNLIRNNS